MLTNQVVEKKDQFCTFPFESVEINFDGKLYFCCSSWQKKPFGTFETSTIATEWNSYDAQEIRQSIIDGNYKFCNDKICPYLQSGTLKKFAELTEKQQDYFTKKQTIREELPNNLMLNYDQSCNLTCESCRLEKISYNIDSPEFSALKNLTDKFTKDFFEKSSGDPIHLNITGSGDPFASVVFRQFLEELDGSQFSNLTIELQTNGVLLTPRMWSRLHKIHKNIKQIIVSIDAATSDTYDVVRRGGHWNQLISNIEFLRKLRQENKLSLLQVNMIVQKRNYFEMHDFIKMFDLPGIDTIHFSLIVDWHTWDKITFNQQAVWMEDNAEHSKFIDLLTSPLFDKPNISLGNMSEFRSNAIVKAYNRLTKTGKVYLHLRNLFLKYSFKVINLFILFKKIICNEKKIFN